MKSEKVRKDTDHENRLHSECGGSSADRWANCPGSVHLLRQCGNQEDTPATLKGTKAHKACEMLLHDFLKSRIDGTDPDIRTHLLTADDEMLANAQSYVDHVWRLGLDESITDKSYAIEKKLILDDRFDSYGSGDFIAVGRDLRGKRRGYAADYKNGYHYVEAEDNAQLAFYAVALRRTIRARGKGKDLDYVTVAIFQPNAGDPAYRDHTFTAARLDHWEKRFVKALENIYLGKKPTFKVGSWCDFCRAKGICKTFQAQAQEKVGLKILDNNSPAIQAAKLTDAQIAKVVLNAPAIYAILKSCSDIALQRFKMKKPIKGLKVVEGKTKRSFLQDDKKVATVFEKRGIDPWRKELKTMGVLEKTLQKKVGKDKAEKLMDLVTTRNLPSLSVVAETDSRVGIAGPTAGLYDELDE